LARRLIVLRTRNESRLNEDNDSEPSREEQPMFVQVIKGHTNDPTRMREQLEVWRRDVKPGAVGFEGSTTGVADDGTVIVLARFTDAAAAQRNADRPEQGAWWEQTAKYFDSEPSFRESSDTSLLFGGGSNEAGFVQIMEGSVSDRAKAETFETPEMLEQLRAARPDLLGGNRVWFEDGTYVEAAYFTSEADARRGEQSGDFSAPQQEYMELFGEPTYIDLREPLLD
jgi:hypothetical protein